MKIKQKLVCLAFSAAAAAALLPGSGLYRLLLQNKSEQVQSWAFPQYFLLLAGLLLGLWGLELLAQRLSENAALVGALVLLLAGIGSFEPLFAMAWAGRFDLVGSIWSTVWLPLVIGLFAGGFGSLGKQAAKTHKKYFLALQAVLLAVILVSMARGLPADFFWTKNKLDFLCAYPFASGAFLGCSALAWREGAVSCAD